MVLLRNLLAIMIADAQHSERCLHTVQFLAGGTMAVLRVQWLLPAQLILDLPTMAASLISHVKIRIVVVDLVWCTVLPLIVLPMHLALITIITIFARVVQVLTLWRGSHMEIELREAVQGE